VHLKSGYPGSQSVAVCKSAGNKDPHFVIEGATRAELDPWKINRYLSDYDWTDKGSPGWITPHIRCDEFLRENNDNDKEK